MSVQKELRHSGHKAVERLLALRDEIKLQGHLLSLDAQRRLLKLEEQVSALEQRTEREGEQAWETLKDVAQELTTSLNELVSTRVNDSLGLLTSVRTLMSTHVRSCGPDDSLSLAAHLMWNEDCGIVPVVSAEHQVLGVVTDRDVCMATYIQGRGPSELRVGSAMSKRVVSCSPEDSIGAALNTMAGCRVRRLPVLGSDGRLMGMLSLADVARWAAALTNPTIDAALSETLAAVSARIPHKLRAAAE